MSWPKFVPFRLRKNMRYNNIYYFLSKNFEFLRTTQEFIGQLVLAATPIPQWTLPWQPIFVGFSAWVSLDAGG